MREERVKDAMKKLREANVRKVRESSPDEDSDETRKGFGASERIWNGGRAGCRLARARYCRYMLAHTPCAIPLRSLTRICALEWRWNGVGMAVRFVLTQLDLKIYINDYRTSYQLALSSDQSTEVVIREALNLANLQPDPMYTIFEVVTDFGFGTPPPSRPPTRPCRTRVLTRPRIHLAGRLQSARSSRTSVSPTSRQRGSWRRPT